VKSATVMTQPPVEAFVPFPSTGGILDTPDTNH